MHRIISILVAIASFALAGSSSYARGTSDNLTVHTRTGTFIGSLNDSYPDVRQFKYIPYAKPPVGPLRWTSPERLDNSSEIYESTVFGPACPQFVSSVPSAWALNITGNLVVNYGESLLAGDVAWNSAEDCLTLAVWTPADAMLDSRLPVIVYLTGGGDATGGVNIPTQLPSNWVHNSQKHIVVTTNYRVNIFAYPHARGLNGSDNFGLQDQRMAVEWVAENIAAFGGDASRITLWGQSAGAIATDMYLFAYYEDPIIHAAIASSGTALASDVLGETDFDYGGTNFTFVAKSLGCDFDDAGFELECMRHVPMQRIENFIGQYQDNSTLVNTSQPAIKFTHQVDNKYVFPNYTERFFDGKIAQVPEIIGTTAREGSALAPYHPAGPPEQAVLDITLGFVCPAHNTSLYRNDIGLLTYRYEWAGNFSNISPVPWLGAYHYSDLYMLFGTYVIAPGIITDLEVQTSLQMQRYFYDFINDPTSLPANGWPAYNVWRTGGGSLARFGADTHVVQIVDGDVVEGVCHFPGLTYNSTP